MCTGIVPSDDRLAVAAPANDQAMSMSGLGSISSSDLLDATIGQHQGCGSKNCPRCGQEVQGKPDWVGLPAGVKFDPTDQELIEHLEAKVSAGELKSHPLIDDFILTIEGEDGICYTHPERLPGVTKDGLSKHFFHRPSKAYTTGTRKRRKVQSLEGSETRWHKTGKTRPVLVNGQQKGCKKILVLYTNFGKNRKPQKTNWVMHQYHLGLLEEEKDGELVVSKIFFQTQPRQCNWTADRIAAIATDAREALRDNASVSSSSKEALNPRDEMLSTGGISAYSEDSYSFLPYDKSFDQVLGEASGCLGGEGGTRPSDNQELHEHPSCLLQEQQGGAASVFHGMTPSDSLAAVLPPAPNDEPCGDLGPYVVSRTLFNNDKFQETSLPNCDEPEWLKYPYWPDTDSRDHHG